MKAVVVYDTKFGNTKQVAEGIAEVLNADIINVSAIDSSKLREYDVFAFGCPVHAWNMSAGMKKALKLLEGESFVGKKVGTFDTRIASRFAGNAAKKIQSKLKKLGFDIAMKPVHFIVTGREGPLAEGEMEKVKAFTALK
ncbi:MAG: flavodoxin family protein [Promethearchaeota archaeon]